MTDGPRIPLSAYCRSRGVSPQAARKAIRDGRLGGAVVRNGSNHWEVLPSVADRLWGKTPLVQTDGPCPHARGEFCITCVHFDEAAAAVVRLERRIARLIESEPTLHGAFRTAVSAAFEQAADDLADVIKHPAGDVQ